MGRADWLRSFRNSRVLVESSWVRSLKVLSRNLWAASLRRQGRKTGKDLRRRRAPRIILIITFPRSASLAGLSQGRHATKANVLVREWPKRCLPEPPSHQPHSLNPASTQRGSKSSRDARCMRQALHGRSPHRALSNGPKGCCCFPSAVLSFATPVTRDTERSGRGATRASSAASASAPLTSVFREPPQRRSEPWLRRGFSQAYSRGLEAFFSLGGAIDMFRRGPNAPFSA
eukprot:scaffold362_cov246-Pinguiococcus_pyrenoidosus.AAC.8